LRTVIIFIFRVVFILLFPGHDITLFRAGRLREREKQQQKRDFKETAAAENRHFQGLEQQAPSYILFPPG